RHRARAIEDHHRVDRHAVTLFTHCVGREVDLDVHFPTRLFGEEVVFDLGVDVERRQQQESEHARVNAPRCRRIYCASSAGTAAWPAPPWTSTLPPGRQTSISLRIPNRPGR